jgi:eukaryotic-like serine/threonine-protein kinase
MRRAAHCNQPRPCYAGRVRDQEATQVPSGAHTQATTRPTLAHAPELPEPPTTLGRFRVLAELGRGGMGVVYSAYDDRLDRRVAIKVVDLQRVGERGRARVRREAQALARLSHPNVVQVFEVGEVDEAFFGGPSCSSPAAPKAFFGGPSCSSPAAPKALFLAMEHVEGATLRQWANAAPRGFREVLGVYRQAAAGLAAAHDKGLVHRDFKPDNAIVGADGRVRVLDFGLAREQDGETSAYEPMPADPRPNAVTQTGAVLGTPAYMAPEQFLGARLDARTDQFALCVSLYEALYGRRPFEGATRLALLDAVTRGRMVEPPEGRMVPPWVLAALRRGLHPDKAARFADLRALLVSLEPPARRRSGWVALGLGGLALVGAGVWTTADAPPCRDAASQWATVWTPKRRDAVSRALARAPVPYAEHARARVLATLDGYGAGWIDEHTAACAATRVDHTQSADVMDLRMRCLASSRRRFAALVDVLAEADAGVAEHAVKAVTELPAVARCADEEYVSAQVEPPDPETALQVEALRVQLDTAIARYDAGQHAAARELAQQVAEQTQALGYRPLLAEAELWLGVAQDAMGEPGAAVQTLRAAFFDARAAGMDEVAVQAATQLVFDEGYRLYHYDAADTWAEHARATLERIGGGPLEPALHMAVANADLARGRYQAAQAGYERAVHGLTAELGPTHPRVARALGNLANTEFYLGDLQAAAALNERVLELEREALGPSHPDVSRAISNLGSVYLAMDRYDEALEQLRASLAIDLAAVGPRHPDVLGTRSNIALVYGKQGDLVRSLAEQRELVLLTQEVHGDDSEEVASVLGNMAGTLIELGEGEEAVTVLRRAVAIVEQVLPPDHPEVAHKLFNLALVEYQLEARDAALEHARRALEIREQGLPPLHHDRATSYMLLSAILESRGEIPAARDAAMAALELRERGKPPSVGELGKARMKAARLSWEAGGDRAHAYVLVERARDEFLAGGDGWRDEYERAVEWLARHPRPQ